MTRRAHTDIELNRAGIYNVTMALEHRYTGVEMVKTKRHTLVRKTRELTVNLPLSLCSSKSNPSVSSPDLPQNTRGSLPSPVPIARASHISSPSNFLTPTHSFVPASKVSRNSLEKQRPLQIGKQVS